jgi:predicted MFS family arabinose efflux permease
LLLVSGGFMAAFIFSQLKHRRLATQLMIPTAIVALAFGAHSGLTDSWASINALVMLGAAAIAIISIPIGMRGSPEPLLHLDLFRDGTFSWAMVLSFLVVTALFGGMLLVPIYLQQVRGFDALETGLLLLPMAAVAAITMPIGGILADRIGPRPVVITGLVPLTLGGVLLAQLHPNSSIWLLMSAMALRGFGMGFVMMPSMSAALARIPRQFTSRASSVTNSLQRVSSSIGIAVLVTILAGQFSTSTRDVPCNPPAQVLAAVSQQSGHPVSAAAFCAQLQHQFSNVQFKGGGTAASSTSAQGPVRDFVKSYADNVLSDSFDRTFAFIAFITVIGVIPALFLRKPEKQQNDRTPALAA